MSNEITLQHITDYTSQLQDAKMQTAIEEGQTFQQALSTALAHCVGNLEAQIYFLLTDENAKQRLIDRLPK